MVIGQSPAQPIPTLRVIMDPEEIATHEAQLGLGPFTLTPSDLIGNLKGKIAFSSPSKIVIANANKTQRLQLSIGDNTNGVPLLSPDGAMIAVTQYDNNNSRLFVGFSDGGNLHELTGDSGSIGEVAWSSDGTLLAYIRKSHVGFELYVVNMRQGEQTTKLDLPFTEVHEPAWSQDNTQLAFRAVEDGKGTIYTAKLNDTKSQSIQLKRLSPHNKDCSAPIWSPNTDRVLYQCNENDLNLLYLVDVTHPDVVVPIAGQNSHHDPVWSPDGDSIACVSSFDDHDELLIVRLADLSIRKLTESRSKLIGLVSSPDGSYLLFVTKNLGAYVVSVDNGYIELWSQDDVVLSRPSWSP